MSVDVCEYCGCQQNSVIAQLTAEHDRLRELGHALAAAAETSDVTASCRLATQMQAVLGPHTRVEEAGLFPALSADFGDHIDLLVAEHRDLDAALGEIASGHPVPGWPSRTRLAVDQLFEHILKEQDGVFPAALATLTTSEWETLAAVGTHTDNSASVEAPEEAIT